MHTDHVQHEAAKLRLLELLREMRREEDPIVKNHDEAKAKLLDSHDNYVESK